AQSRSCDRSDPHRARRRLFTRRPVRQAGVSDGPGGITTGATSAQRPFVAPPFAGGLISNPRVIGAIRQAGYRVAATEKEVVTAGVADRPAAGLLVEFQNGPALADWNDVVDQFRFGLQFEIVSMRQCHIA